MFKLFKLYLKINYSFNDGTSNKNSIKKPPSILKNELNYFNLKNNDSLLVSREYLLCIEQIKIKEIEEFNIFLKTTNCSNMIRCEEELKSILYLSLTIFCRIYFNNINVNLYSNKIKSKPDIVIETGTETGIIIIEIKTKNVLNKDVLNDSCIKKIVNENKLDRNCLKLKRCLNQLIYYMKIDKLKYAILTNGEQSIFLYNTFENIFISNIVYQTASDENNFFSCIFSLIKSPENLFFTNENNNIDNVQTLQHKSKNLKLIINFFVKECDIKCNGYLNDNERVFFLKIIDKNNIDKIKKYNQLIKMNKILKQNNIHVPNFICKLVYKNFILYVFEFVENDYVSNNQNNLKLYNFLYNLTLKYFFYNIDTILKLDFFIFCKNTIYLTKTFSINKNVNFVLKKKYLNTILKRLNFLPNLKI